MDVQTEEYISHHTDALISRMDQFLSPFTLSIFASAINNSQNTTHIERKLNDFIKQAVTKAFDIPAGFDNVFDWSHPLMSANPSGFAKTVSMRNPLEAHLEQHIRKVLEKYGFNNRIIDNSVKVANDQLTAMMNNNGRAKLSDKILSFCANPQIFDQKDWSRSTIIALSSYTMLKAIEIIETAPAPCADALISGVMHDPNLLQQRKRVAELLVAICLNSLINNNPIPSGVIEKLFSVPPINWAQGVFYFKNFSNLKSISSAQAKMVQEILQTAISYEPSGSQSIAFNLSESLGLSLDQADAIVGEMAKQEGSSEFDLQKTILSMQKSNPS